MASDFRASEIVAATPSQRATIRASAAAIFCAPKNTGVHSKFSPNCMMKTPTACLARRWIKRPSAHPISKYNSDHTGPKTHGGGVPGGLTSS